MIYPSHDLQAFPDVMPQAIRGGCLPTSSTAMITIVIPVRNEARFIATILTQLLNQDYDPDCFEILVVDGQSTDGTPALVAEFAKAHPNIRIFDNPRRLSSAARNIAIRHARGDVVLLIDGHCELADRHYLRKLVAAFDRSGADCIGRPQPLSIAGASTLQRAIAAARSSRLGHHPDSFVYSSQEQFVPAKSVAVAYRRSVFERVGYFDESFDACEDVEFNHRIDLAGMKCYFTPEVLVHYAPRDTIRDLFRQLIRYGRGRGQLMSKYPETFSLGSMLPAILTWCIVNLPLVFSSHWVAMLYLEMFLIYGTVVLLTSAWIAIRHNDMALLPWLPLVFVTVHAGSGVGLLQKMFTSSEGVQDVKDIIRA